MNMIQDLIAKDIFNEDLTRRAKELYQALFDRRTALNHAKSKLLKSNRRYKLTPQYEHRLENVKNSITFLTQRINQIKTMMDRNIIDSDTLGEIQSDYKHQVYEI